MVTAESTAPDGIVIAVPPGVVTVPPDGVTLALAGLSPVSVFLVEHDAQLNAAKSARINSDVLKRFMEPPSCLADLRTEWLGCL
jgi:hypothetical protein